MKEKFLQLSFDLKLIVVLFFLFGLNSFWKFGNQIVINRFIEIGPVISGSIELALAIGLINRSNFSRWWAVFLVFLNFLFGLFLLAIAIFDNPTSTEGFGFSYDRLTRTQTIIFIAVYLFISGWILFVLVKPKTRDLFSGQDSQESIS